MTFTKDCGHCGRTETLTVPKDGQVVIHRVAGEAAVGPDLYDTESTEEQVVIEVAGCSHCHQPTFTRYKWIEPFFDDPDQAYDVQVLYPVQRDSADLPENVGRRYRDMLDVTFNPALFAVQAGKCLEAVCAERGLPARGKNDGHIPLHQRLEKLVADNHLPEMLGKQALLVKEFRNLGGHDSDDEPTVQDLAVIRGFTESVLDYLYWGPAKLARSTATFEARADAAKKRRQAGSTPSA